MLCGVKECRSLQRRTEKHAREYLPLDGFVLLHARLWPSDLASSLALECRLRVRDLGMSRRHLEATQMDFSMLLA